jgi:hypothetical protein
MQVVFPLCDRSRCETAVLKAHSQSAAGCVNDTIIPPGHPRTWELRRSPERAVMGTYHGKAIFDTFTHYKWWVVKKSNRIDLPSVFTRMNKEGKNLFRFLH